LRWTIYVNQNPFALRFNTEISKWNQGGNKNNKVTRERKEVAESHILGISDTKDLILYWET